MSTSKANWSQSGSMKSIWRKGTRWAKSAQKLYSQRQQLSFHALICERVTWLIVLERSRRCRFSAKRRGFQCSKTQVGCGSSTTKKQSLRGFMAPWCGKQAALILIWSSNTCAPCSSSGESKVDSQKKSHWNTWAFTTTMLMKHWRRPLYSQPSWSSWSLIWTKTRKRSKLLRSLAHSLIELNFDSNWK